MGIEIDRLNGACPVLGAEKFGSLLDQAILLLNDAKAAFNGHTHASTNNPPNSTLVTAAIVDTVNSIVDMNLLCAVGLTSFGTQINRLVTLANEIRSQFNAHGHSAVGTVATEQLVSVGMTALTNGDQNTLNTVCVSLGDPKIGTRLTVIEALLTELKVDYNAHVHPTLITNAADLTVASADIAVLI